MPSNTHTLLVSKKCEILITHTWLVLKKKDDISQNWLVQSSSYKKAAPWFIELSRYLEQVTASLGCKYTRRHCDCWWASSLTWRRDHGHDICPAPNWPTNRCHQFCSCTYGGKLIERCSYNCFLGCNENAQNIIFNVRLEREVVSEGVDQASLLTWPHLHPI